MQYVISEIGDATRQEGSEEYPFVGTDGFKQVQSLVLPGDTVVVRGRIMGQVRWTSNGYSDNLIRIVPHGDGGHIDGGYSYPRGPAAWVAPDGTEGVHSSLVSIRGSYVNWQVPVINSRGRCIQLYTCHGSSITDTATSPPFST